MKPERSHTPRQKTLIQAATLAVACAAAGCASIGELQVPAAPVASAWPTQLTADASDGAAQVHWRTFFPDPRLQELIAAALDNNRDLRIAAARVQEARAQFGLAKADRLPTINLVGSGSFSKTPGDLSATGSPVSGERYDLSLTAISFEMDLWGRLAGLSDAAKSSVLATQAAQRAVHIALIADVANAYFSVLQLDEMAELARYAVETREQSLLVVGKGRDAGAANEAEYLLSLSILESTRAASEAMEYQRAVAMNRLQFLVGKMPEALPKGQELDQQRLVASLPSGLPGDILLQRPDVIAAEYRLRAAHANVGAARAAFWPRILLTAGAGVASQGLSSLFNAGSWTFQPSIALPLFDGGRIESGKDLADARKDIAVAEYEKTIQLAFREVADLLAAGNSTAKQLRSAAANEKAQKTRLDIAMARQAVGLISYLEVLDAQRELLAARQTAIQVRKTQLDTASQLYRALGGGQAEPQLVSAAPISRGP